ncbi:MAG TPA: hypothetical protein VGG67_02180 [Steroidobacteraceae bacterium]
MTSDAAIARIDPLPSSVARVLLSVLPLLLLTGAQCGALANA